MGCEERNCLQLSGRIRLGKSPQQVHSSRLQGKERRCVQWEVTQPILNQSSKQLTCRLWPLAQAHKRKTHLPKLGHLLRQRLLPTSSLNQLIHRAEDRADAYLTPSHLFLRQHQSGEWIRLRSEWIRLRVDTSPKVFFRWPEWYGAARRWAR